MQLIVRLFFTIMLFFTLVMPVAAALIRVPQDVGMLQTAIAQAQEGDIIELAADTYPSPGGDGFTINDKNVNFTIRAASGANVILTGNNSSRLLRMNNVGAGNYSVVFQGLRFTSGLSNTNGRGGGLTLSNARATFIDCQFDNNSAVPTNTGGGALFISQGSTVFFFGSTFEANTAKNEGAALRVELDSQVHVHQCEFIDNKANISDHRTSAAGGAIHLTNSLAEVSNSRFSGNKAGCVGGAIYALGTWQEPVTTPAAELFVANSTFIDNSSAPHESVTCGFTPVGGAVHVEDHVTAKIFQSRFETNSAEIGGGLSMYRSIVEIDDSIFQGNEATGTGTSNFGGAIMSNSNDANDATTAGGTINRRSASLTLRDSLFRGRFGAVTETSFKGGCLFVEGDTRRTFGGGGVTPMGTAAENRSTVTIERSVFADCDVIEDPATVGTGAGGGLSIGHANLTMDDSLIVDCDAVGSTAAGGGMRVVTDTVATITDTTFAYNTAGSRGGAIQVSGSQLNVDQSRFFGNEVTTGSPGSAIWSATLTFRSVPLDVTGVVSNNIFSAHVGREIDELDNAAGPINDLRYNGNQFFSNPVNAAVFSNQLEGAHTAPSLNSLVVVRNGGVGNTDKSTVANPALGSQPRLGALVAAPPEILLEHAVSDSVPGGETFLGFAWSAAGGTSVQLFGAPLAATSGLETAGSGVHTLEVGTTDFLASTADAAIPTATFDADPQTILSPASADLDWSITAGTLLDVEIDRDVTVTTPTATGSETVQPGASTQYNLYVLTEEGGVHLPETLFVDELQNLIFSDEFESGGLAAWTVAVGN